MNHSKRSNDEMTQLYHRYVQTVYRVCFIYMKNKQDTQDMVQNTFIRLMKDTTKFEGSEHEKAWLIRTAVNLCKDYYRKNRATPMDLTHLPEESVSDSYDLSGVLEKVLALPAKYKTVIYMYYYEGYTSVQIAKILGEKESTIRSRLHHGRKRLKMEMEAEFL